MSWSHGVYARGMESSAQEARMRADQMQREVQIKMQEMQMQHAMMLMASKPTNGRGSHSAKCPGCGSHEWRQHNNVRICAYCRSGQ